MIKIAIKIDQCRIGTGHKQHRSGAGYHQHRNTKRNRTRGAILKRVLKEI
jgi:hypothetical protein